MEEYKKKYEEIIKSLKEAKESMGGYTFSSVVDKIIPELKESEDENVRKEILQSIKDNMIVIHKDKCIAWLEKQGEQNPTDKVEPKFKVGDWVTNGINFTFQVRSIEDNMYLRSDEYFIDIETADKTFRLWTIQDAKDGDVLVGSYDNCKKPWIGIFKCISKDKPTTQFDSYCFLTSSNHIFTTPLSSDFYNRCKGHTSRYVLPATKEQRDTLMKAMADAGYTFDFEKKELKKIEQKAVGNALKEAFDKSKKDYSLEEKKEASDYSESIIPTSITYGESEEEYMLHKIIEAAFIAGKNNEQKSTWSEEDMEMIDLLIAIFRVSYPDEVYKANPIHTIDMKSVSSSEIIDWLKHIKDRYAWKPSDEQMKALNYVINLMASSESPTENDYYYNVFKNMRTHLKKLREE